MKARGSLARSATIVRSGRDRTAVAASAAPRMIAHESQAAAGSLRRKRYSNAGGRPDAGQVKARARRRASEHSGVVTRRKISNGWSRAEASAVRTVTVAYAAACFIDG